MKRSPPFVSLHGRLGNVRILLAKSPEQNLCGKIYSHHGAKLDENRTSTLTCSTTMHSIVRLCRLVVISPTVSGRFGTRRPANGEKRRLSLHNPIAKPRSLATGICNGR